MRFFSTLLTVLAALSGVVAAPYTDAQYEQLFTKWVAQHNKVYPRDQFFTKFHNFKSNLAKIHQHNSRGYSYTLEMNEFGDMTQQEFKQLMTGFNGERPHSSHHHPMPELSLDTPTAVDWRTKNAVTPIKNQGQCGSCYTFSATGALEGAVAIASGTLTSLSEQQLLDCSGKAPFGNQGCNGGWMDTCFQWVIANGGITSDALDPYIAAVHTDPGTWGVLCQNFTSVATITGYVDVPKMNESALLVAAAQQPISIAIEADSMQFQFYSSGVLDDAGCGTTLDHGVLIVGYGTDASLGKDYWIVKNSWDASWGEQGYVRLVRDKDQCGLAQQPSYPTGAKHF